MANKSYRLMYRFWLDMNKADEEAIADEIEILKNERSFTATIRDGIRLIVDLRKGKLDVLFELFPWVQSEFMKYMKDITPDSGGGSDTSDLKREIDDLKQLILSQNSTPTHIMSEQPKVSGLKPLGGLAPIGSTPQFTTPVYDDEDDGDLLVVSQAKSDGQAAHNFLASMNALQQ